MNHTARKFSKAGSLATAFGIGALSLATPSLARDDTSPTGPDASGYLATEQAARVTYQANPDFVVKLDGEINQDMAGKIKFKLYELARKDPKQDIVLEISSGGGEVSAGWAILDAIHAIPNKVHTLCSRAESMAAVILISNLSGNRYAYQHCRIMLHEPSWEMKGTASNMSQRAGDISAMRAQMIGALSRASGMKDDMTMDFVMSGDTVIPTPQAYMLNFIDGIIPERKSQRVMRDPQVAAEFCTADRQRMVKACANVSMGPGAVANALSSTYAMPQIPNP